MTKINTVIFDIGNVIVRWAPSEIIRLTFGDTTNSDVLVSKIFGGDIWRALNMGLLSEEQAKVELMKKFGTEFHLTPTLLDGLFYYVKETQIPLYRSIALLQRLAAAGYRLFALTDNVHEIMAFLKQRYDFWQLFEGIVVSADIGLMKPDKEIFLHLSRTYDVPPQQAVFMDDVPMNVEGARLAGFQAFCFQNSTQAKDGLKQLGLNF